MTTRYMDLVSITDKPSTRDYDFFDDETFNFLVELHVVCFGIYYNMFDYALKDPRRLNHMIGIMRKQYRSTLGKYKPNTFQIVKAIRLGILKR